MDEARAQAMAIEALAFLGGAPERLTRFLEVSGLSPETLRAAARSPGFFAGLMDYLVSDEALLVAFAANGRSGERHGRTRDHGRPIGTPAVAGRARSTHRRLAPAVRRARSPSAATACRDAAGAPPRRRCPACGSPRLLAHPERDALVDRPCRLRRVLRRRREARRSEPCRQAGDRRRRQARRRLDRLLRGAHLSACARPCRCSRPWRPARTPS